MTCCTYHDEGRTGYYYSIRKTAVATEAKLARRGEVGYGDIHLIARLRLGLLDDPPVACAGCGVTDCHARLQAALNWPAVPDDRLRECSYSGSIYSASPDDYLALCSACHSSLDSWRTALKLRGAPRAFSVSRATIYRLAEDL